jgi:hypothetical protein
LPVGDGQQVGAELADLVDQPGLRRGGEPEHGDDRGDPDRDSERRQGRPNGAGAQTDAGKAGEVGQAELWRVERSLH